MSTMMPTWWCVRASRSELISKQDTALTNLYDPQSEWVCEIDRGWVLSREQPALCSYFKQVLLFQTRSENCTNLLCRGSLEVEHSDRHIRISGHDSRRRREETSRPRRESPMWLRMEHPTPVLSEDGLNADHELA